jgi:integrase
MAKIDKLLNGSIIRGLQPPDEGNVIIYDGGMGSVAGFGVRLTAAGARSFILNYRTKSGRERRYTIGATERWTATDARKEANRLRRLIDEGGDPLADIEAEREAPTMTELCDRFEAEWLPRKRTTTAAFYERILRCHIRPHFGKHIKVADVVGNDIDKLHRKVTNTGHTYVANRVVAVLSKMFDLAERWGMREQNTNPCEKIERNKEYLRKRYVEGDELARLCTALAEHPDKEAADIIRMLLLTGARKGEVLSMVWRDVDLSKGIWSKPASSTKQKEDHVVPLSAAARQLLSERRGKGPVGEFVFRGDGVTGHRLDIKRNWRKITKAAGIAGLRVHDLRHSFASQLVSAGSSLPLIGALLGHSNPRTTARYSHVFADPMKAAVEKVGAIIDAASNGKPASPPTPMIRRGRHG